MLARDERCIQNFDWKTVGKRQLLTPFCSWEDSTEVSHREMGWGNVDWVHLAQDRDQW
jgi:hypothetical protein